MKLSRRQKQYVALQSILLFLFISMLWLLDMSVSFLGSGHLVTLLLSWSPDFTYHIALVGIMTIYMVTMTYHLFILEEDKDEGNN